MGRTKSKIKKRKRKIKAAEAKVTEYITGEIASEGDARITYTQAMKFEADRWIYLRRSIYPMVHLRHVLPGESCLGDGYSIEPVIYTPKGKLPVSDGDMIVKHLSGNYYPIDEMTFKSNYIIAG